MRKLTGRGHKTWAWDFNENKTSGKLTENEENLSLPFVQWALVSEYML
jgi:hypothetical protein